MAQLTNLQLFVNTDSYLLYVVTNEDESEVIDIASWTLSFLVKTHYQDADTDAVLTKTTTSGIIVSGTHNIDPNTNTQQATVSVAAGDTDDLDPGTYVWEFKRTDAGSETVLAYGQLALLHSVHAG